MILYPTETLYALGVNAFDEEELEKLFALKDREKSKVSSVLVRSVADIETYAVFPQVAQKIAAAFLPGSLTLVLEASAAVPRFAVAPDGTVGFRITTDPKAQSLIDAFMATHNAPLTCTSANVSGAPTLGTVGEILQQFGSMAHMIDTIIDDGPRKGLASTIVSVVGDEVRLLREGVVAERDIRNVLV